MKEAKKGICYKCGNLFYVHEHHVLPKAIFGKDGETVKLCPNCHTHFHEYSKKETTNPEDKEEALLIWTTWRKTVAVVVSVWIIAFILILSF
jgi:Zn-finger protein